MDDGIEVQGIEQEDHQVDLRGLFRGAIRLVIETTLEEELRELVGAERYQRLGTRQDRRNGSYLRKVLTSMGHVEVAIPRSRESGSPVDVLGRYQRRSLELDDAITAAYVEGVSTRDMTRVTQALTGEGVSRSTVSRITK